MTYYKQKYNLKSKNFKLSEKYGNMNISLPLYPLLKNKEVDYICKIVKDLNK